MMYYNMWGAPVRQEKKVEVKPIEYAFEDEVQVLRRELEVVDNHVRCLLDKEAEHRKDCEQMYQVIDMLKYDTQQIEQGIKYLYHKVESAPSVAKRKRRVTICANGQRVEVCRND